MHPLSSLTFLLLTLLGPATAAAEALSWTRHGVVLSLGPSGSFDEKGLESPIVVREAPDRLVMWYRGRNYSDDLGRVLRAESVDGLNWTPSGVVMVPDQGPLEMNKIDPMAVRIENGTYRMWYGGAGSGGLALHATSPDGFFWTRDPVRPSLMKTSGAWDSSGAGGHHAIVRVGLFYQMFYKGYSTSIDPGTTSYGRAVSFDGVHFVKQGKVIAPDPAHGEGPKFRNLAAFHHSGHYYIVHAIADMPDPLNLRLLRSANGDDWERLGTFFDKGRTPGGYDAKWSTSPSLLIENGLIRMWYEGGNAKGIVRILYAEADVAQLMPEPGGAAGFLAGTALLLWLRRGSKPFRRLRASAR